MTTATLIGCGRIGFILENDPLRNKPCTHFGGMKKNRIHLAGACDIDTKRLDHISRLADLSTDHLHTDYRKALARPTDIVTVSTHTDTHAEIVTAAAESGCRVIICEKPIAHDVRAARRMIDACRANKVHLMINHERRFDPRYRTVKRLIERGAIGEIVSIRGILPTHGFNGKSRASLGGGPLLHDGTHLLDIISFLAGKIVKVDGRFSRIGRSAGFEDHAWALLETETGIPAQISVGGGTKYFGFGVEVFGTTGKIEIGNGFNRLFRMTRSKYYKGFFDLTETAFPAYKGNCFSELYREAKHIAQHGGNTQSSGEDGLAALEAIHAIYLSGSRRKEVSIPLQETINIKKIFALGE
ncbi:MAG TPA: Gfo/Idh/MocA family oxidoreductase [Spirochaetota bacterium]|nr:Gfo/Idh/MocA family oxidoreductase [Spirochaetota bacterium]